MKKILILLSASALVGCSVISSNLRGTSEDEILAQMGTPKSIMKDGDREMWTYQQGSCSKYIFFDASKTVQYTEEVGSCWR